MNTLFAAVIVIVAIATYASPFLLTAAWIRRWRTDGAAGIRFRVGWISLGLASLGLVAFFGGLFIAPEVATPNSDHWFWQWFVVCSCISGATLLTGLIGKGKMQWAVVLWALNTPLGCMLAKIFE